MLRYRRRRSLTGAVLNWARDRTAQALALFRADDDHFTDEEILMILRAGEAGLTLADVCGAGGIRAATYFAWRVKYNGLTPSEVRARRRRERRKRRAIPAFAALVLLGVGAAGTVLGIPNASQLQEASANAPESPLISHPTAPAASAMIVVPPSGLESTGAEERELQTPAVRQPTQGDDAGQPVGAADASATAVPAQDIATTDANGYVVQVAAVPNLQEARAVLEQLAKAGYPAYLTPKIVDRVELYRVRVGPLKSWPVAQEVARRLEREGHPAPWVTK